MSFGQFALGLAGVVLGAKTFLNGAKRIRNSAPRRPRTPKLPPPILKSSQSGKTGIGNIRLRTYQIRNLPERMQYLQALVEQGKRDPVVYEFARQAINQKCSGNWCVPEKDNQREIVALFKHIRKNVRYTSDITNVDSYQKPRHTLALRTADCDDYATLICAAAATLGLPCRFKVIKTKGSREWNHIYAQIGLPRRNPTQWFSLDASINMPAGWEPPKNMVSDHKIFPT